MPVAQLNINRDAISKTAAEAVRLSFNPSGSDEVDTLKLIMAAWITEVEKLKNRAAREAAVAITQAQGASMWGVFAATTGK